jgi:hypothetical protein
MPITIDGSNGITQAGEFNSDSTFGFKNRIINGAMVIDQRNAGASVTVNSTTNTYGVDRWYGFGQSTDGVFTIQQNTSAPTGFINSTKITITTADASIGATQAYRFSQSIEGLNCTDLGFGSASAKTITLSFWVRSSLTGTFGGNLSNSGFTRAYPFTYTINSANTWEQKSVTIAGDTTGTWLTTSGIGMTVSFVIGMGSTFTGTANAWNAGLYFAPTGGTNIISTLNADIYFTGVQLEVGSTATSFDYRPYGTELALCQRYYYKMTGSNVTRFGCGQCFGTTSGQAFVAYSTVMRDNPTALEQSGTASHYRVTTASGGTQNLNAVPTFAQANLNTATINFAVASGIVAGDGTMFLSNNADAFLAWSAEL